MNDFVALGLGFGCAFIGGEMFVRGAVGLAHWARISPGIIAVTVVAFATSSPELSVATNAALVGMPQIGLGDTLGSNVVNVGLIFALALVISGIQAPRDSVKRDFSVALLIPIITGVLILDGELSRFDGLLLGSMFLAWLVAVIVEALKQRRFAEKVLGEHRGWQTVLLCAIGLAFLVAAGKLIVMGAKGIAIALGIDEFIIAATIVAVGTSTPELATTIIAKLRGHDEISLGTILGSNIFNGSWITAVTAIIHPIPVAGHGVAIALVFGLMVVVFTYPPRTGFITRRRGILLLVLYAAYLATILQGQAA